MQGVRRSSWSQANAAGANGGWQTVAITGAGVATAGAPISAVSRMSGSIDLVFLSGNALEWMTWNGAAFTTPTAITRLVEGPVSLVAGSSTSLDVFYQDIGQSAATSHWNFATNSWSTAPFPFATANVGGLLTLGNTAGRCLDVLYGNPNAGAEIDSAACNGTSSQKFAMNNGGQLVSMTNPTLCVDYSTPSEVRLEPCGSPSQVFAFNGGALQTIWGQCLDVYGASTVSGTPVDVTTCNGTAAQAFLPFNIPAQIEATNPADTTPECLGAWEYPVDTLPVIDVVTTPCASAPYITVDAYGELQMPLSASYMAEADGANCIAMNNATWAGFAVCNEYETRTPWQYLNGHLRPIYAVEQLPSLNDCLDVYFASTASNTEVDITGCNGGVAQNWAFSRADGTTWPWAELP